ncbi:C11orf80 [Branchiostoma lanceolatum]|uniref:C11orf80 protein n=1 Tax=Branchiostoma lanceolatum TaxID=7740 RepID=A0A8J9ZSW0_BRALA|nr:C11orf80 [Branchiostoma lanceolatum]
MCPSDKLYRVVAHSQAYSPEEYCLWSDLVGEQGRTRRCIATLGAGPDDVSVREIIKKVPSGWQGFSVQFKVLYSRMSMLSECHAISASLHRIHLLSPEISLEYQLGLDEQQSTVKYLPNRGSFRTSIGQRKLLTDIDRYLCSAEIPDWEKKIRPRAGSRMMLNPVRLSDSTQVRVQLCVAAAVTPPVDRTLLSNHWCKSVQLYSYGPAGVPLFLHEKCPLPVSHLVRWEDYGLKLAGELTHSKQEGVAWPDCTFQLETASAATVPQSQPQQGQGEGQGPSHVLQLFLLLELPSTSVPTISQQIDLLSVLRRELGQLGSDQRVKFSRAAHSALNKVLNNHADQREKQVVMEKAIPHIAEAMQTVLRYSTDDSFRNRCFAAVQVEDSRGLSTAVSARLWDIAADKYQVTPPDSVTDSQAVSSAEPPASASLQNSCSSSDTQLQEVPRVATCTEPSRSEPVLDPAMELHSQILDEDWSSPDFTESVGILDALPQDNHHGMEAADTCGDGGGTSFNSDK